LDIYGKYQENIGEITKNYDALEMNLTKEYQAEKRKGFENIMTTQFNIEVAKMDEATQDIIFNIQSGENTGGLSPFEYLEKNKDSMTTENYRAIYGALQAQQVEEINSGLESGFYGNNEKGERITDPMEYIAGFENTLNPDEYTKLQGQVMFMQEVEAVNQTDFNVESTKDPTSVNYDPNFDPSYGYRGDENITQDSDVFTVKAADGLEREYVQIMDIVDKDDKNPDRVSSEELYDYFEEDPEGIFEGQSATPGTIIDYKKRGTLYVKKATGWHRLTDMQQQGENKILYQKNNENFKQAYSELGKSELTIGETTYVQNKKHYQSFDTKKGAELSDNEQSIVDRLEGFTVGAIYDEETKLYWTRWGKNYYPMTKK
jgi:hypothetical protein